MAFLCLLLAEVAVRLCFPFPLYRIEHEWVRLSENPQLIYELNPALPDHNSEAMRDRGFPRIKPVGSLRVAAIGDSITYGFGVKSEESWPKQLEKMFDEQRYHTPNLRTEVLNFGVPGYSIAEEAAVLEYKALAFDIDAVVLVLCLNDWNPASIEVDQLLAAASTSGAGFVADLLNPSANRVARDLSRLHVYRWMRHGLALVRRSEIPRVPMHLQRGPGGSYFFKRYFDRILQVADNHDLPIIVALMPTLDREQISLYSKRLAEVGALCRAQRCTLLDTLPDLAKKPDPIASWDNLAALYRANDPLHLNAGGNRELAMLIHGVLMSRLPTPSS